MPGLGESGERRRGALKTAAAEFPALYDEMYGSMVRLAYTLLSNAEEAEEVVQDAFATVYVRWETLLNPAGYLRVTVVNGARRTLRRRIHRDQLHQQLGPSQKRATTPNDYILDAVDSLPERQRIAVVLAYYGDLTAVEISDVLDCRPGTAKSLVHRGLKQLKRELRQ